MPKFSIRYKRFFILSLLIILIITAFWFVDVKGICAHTPHDPIDALQISPTYNQDKTLFIVISDHLLRSTDGGFSWKELVNGLDNKHLLTSIAMSPSFHIDKTLFVSSEGDGIYRSQDGGHSWTKVNSGLDSLSIGLLATSADYHSGNIVLATGSGGGLYRTENEGERWQQVIDHNIKITSIVFSPDPKKNYLVAGDDRGFLYISTNGGEAWQQTVRFSNAGAVTSIAISPNFSSNGTFFVGTEKSGIYKTTDGGASFTEVNNGLPFTIREKYGTLRKSSEGPFIRPNEKPIISLVISPAYETDATIFASMWNEAIFRSNDGGNTWQKYPLGLTCDSQADSDKYKSPHFRDLAISTAFAKDKTVFLGGFDGLFKSTDGGQNWTQMETLPLRLIKGLAVSPGDKDDSSIAITTYGGGAYITNDQGLTWAIGNGGLQKTRLSDIVFSPDYPVDNNMFSASNGLLLKSINAGNNWNRSALANKKSWRIRLSYVLRRFGLPAYLSKSILTEAEKTAPYPTVIVLSPDFMSDNTMYFATRWHGIFKSVDGGLNSSAMWNGMGQAITSLVISPGFPSDRTLFAGVRGAGVYKTMDGGETWQPANNGLTFVDAWQEFPTIHQIVKEDIKLVISPYYEIDRTIFAASSEGLFKTIDGGESWQQVEGVVGYMIGMAISPNYENDQTLIISVKGEGLFKTDNGGKIFAKIAPDLIAENQAIELIEFSSSYAIDNTIYAASDEEIFQSTDGGHTWTIINRLVRYENHREVIHYGGEWEVVRGDDFSAMNVSQSDIAGAEATLNFVGTGISWIGTKSDNQGIARVYIDGEYQGDVDQFSDTREIMVELYSITGLADSPHTIRIEVSHEKNPKSAGYRIEIDAFDVLP